MVTEKEILTIGELAARAGVSPRTVRYYVAEGLLPAPGGAGQYRIYTREHYLRLKLIRRLQAEHLPLSEIKPRLAALSLAELESLAAAIPEEPELPEEPREFLETFLADSPAPSLSLSAPNRSETMASRAEEKGAALLRRILKPAVQTERANGSIIRASSPASERVPSPSLPVPSATSGLWQRVVLAPGVELHYQPGDPAREAVAAKIIAQAAQLFAADEKEDGSESAKKKWFHKS